MNVSPRGIMFDYLDRTHVGESDSRSKRYLWTDAFAVCNLLGLHMEEGDAESLRRALQLIDETHRLLGRHRADDPRQGWISGLDEAEGSLHPTVGGLRIGKALSERSEREPFDAALEWERDGQYFHYLTKWMVALSLASRVTGDSRYREWAVELARTAYERFCVRDERGHPVGLCWKMSIDLRRPLVPSMGQHDPLDGYLVYSGLRAARAGEEAGDLSREIDGLSTICVGRDWRTDDILGIGGLLSDAWSLAKLLAAGVLAEPDLLRRLVEVACAGVEFHVRRRFLEGPASRRLAFREFGLSIGLHAVERLRRRLDLEPGVLGEVAGLASAVDAFAVYRPIASEIERFWLEPTNRRADSWIDHLDINEVMLATSLAPRAFLDG